MERTAEERVERVGAGDDEVASAQVPTDAGRPADRIRMTVEEAAERGAPMVSAQAMQTRLFSVYDDAEAVPEALALVQRHLRLTLDRTWYSAQEIEGLADQLDWLLDLATPEPSSPGPGASGAESAAATSG